MEEALELSLRAKDTMIWLSTAEEDRSVPRVQAVAEARGFAVYSWDCVNGFHQLTQGDLRQPADGQCVNVDQALNAAATYTHHRALFVLHDVALLARTSENTPSPDYVMLVRRIKDLRKALRRSDNAVVFLSATPAVPADLEDCVTLVEAALPNQEERAGIVSKWITRNCSNVPCEVDDETSYKLIEAGAGMTSSQIQRGLALTVVKHKGLKPQAVEDMIAEKVAAVKKSEILEFVGVSETLDDVGGLVGLKDYLKKRALAFTRAAEVYGLSKPKGIVLVGPPGVGKSLVARVVAAVLQLPLLAMDVGRIHGSLVGQSEERMRRALALAESQAPAVLELDEFDKAFGGVSGASGDGGTTLRVFGRFLSWMADKTVPVFVVATANNVTCLPPELTRRGRFDECFFVDLPNPDERKAILKVLLRKHGQTRRGLVTEALIKQTQGYSGAELEAAIKDAMFEAFSDSQRPVAARDLRAATAKIVPLADQRREQIEEQRRWGRANARPAS